MKQWYAKELSLLSGVSVRTLHHYDKIDLLKPGLRLDNGYRLYSEKDLLRLQQIIALKFFGFELTQIGILLANDVDALDNFAMQAKFLQAKAATLMEASSILERITEKYSNDKSIPWQKMIELIEVYTMTQKLEHSWVKEIFNNEELKQYANFEAELKSRSSIEEQVNFEKNWSKLVEEVKSNLGEDPNSEQGIDLGKRFMDWVNGIYGKKYAHLRTKKFEEGFAKGKGLDEVGMSIEMVAWIDKAMDAYWRKRIYSILAQVDAIPMTQMLSLWNGVMEEMYGDDLARQKEIIEAALADINVSNSAKLWLKALDVK